MQSISIKELSELPSAVKSILEFAKDNKIFCFYGELGAGKTTLIKEICRQLGVKDKASSPTFSLINEYCYVAAPIGIQNEDSHSKGKENVLYHFDLYRLKSETEIYDIGYEEYIFSGNYCFIEWPEKIERLLPEKRISISIEVCNDLRIICIS